MTDPAEDQVRGPQKPQARRGFVARVGRTVLMFLLFAGMAVLGLLNLFWSGDPAIPPQLAWDNINLSAFNTPPNVTPAPAPDPPAKADPGNPVVPDKGGVAEAAKATETKKRRSVSFTVTTTNVDRAEGAGAKSGARGGGEQGRGGTGIAFKDETIPGRRAGRAVDTTLMLAPGKYDFVLDVDVHSERDGPFFAHAKQDLKSEHGVTLIEEGTRISGTYQSQVAEGQSRIVMLSAYGITQKGIPFTIGAPMGDGRGRVGADGHLNTHTWAKLRNAAFLMLSQGSMQAVQSAIQGALQRSGGTSLNLSTGSMDQALTEAIRSGGRIQGTVELRAGKVVSILLTEPIFFDDSYRLEVR